MINLIIIEEILHLLMLILLIINCKKIIAQKFLDINKEVKNIKDKIQINQIKNIEVIRDLFLKKEVNNNQMKCLMNLKNIYQMKMDKENKNINKKNKEEKLKRK